VSSDTTELIAKARAYVQPSLDRDLWNPGLQSVLDVCNALEATHTTTVMTVEQVNGLPIGSVLLTRHDHLLEKLSDGWFRAGLHYAYKPFPSWVPATVLFTPPTQSGVDA
jgi:hypothetical protein